MKLKRIFMLSLAIVMTLTIASASTCLAYDDGAYSSGTHYNGSFSAAWQKVYNDPKHDTVITYGYNTFAINEDYCYAVQTAFSHYAEIKNGNGYHYGPTKAAGKSSNREVTHAGSWITYYCCW